MEIRFISDLGNTPGLWYAIAYFLSAVFFLHFNHNTRKGLKKWAPLCALGAFLIFFMHITTGCYGLYFMFVMCVVITCLYFIFHLCLEGDFCKRAYYTIRAFMLGEFMASLGWQIFYFGVKNRGVKFDPLHQSISMFTVYFLLLAVGILIERKNAPRNRELIIKKRDLIMVFAIMLVLYSVSNLSYVVVGTPFTTQSTPEFFL